MTPMTIKTDEQWRAELTPEQYDVLRRGGTEPPFTGRYAFTKDDGLYRCAGCGHELFNSQAKFESGTGWPSFTEPAFAENVELLSDDTATAWSAPRSAAVTAVGTSGTSSTTAQGPAGSATASTRRPSTCSPPAPSRPAARRGHPDQRHGRGRSTARMIAAALTVPAIQMAAPWPTRLLSPGNRARARRDEHDRELVAALRAGDEAAFEELVERYQGSLVRVARMYVGDRTAAEEVAQETWLAVLEGIDRFEGRSSLKTWIFRILTNRAKTRGQRERRQLPLSALSGEEEPEVPLDRFLPPDDPERPLGVGRPTPGLAGGAPARPRDGAGAARGDRRTAPCPAGGDRSAGRRRAGPGGGRRGARHQPR